jgi:hypothetical protein
MDYQKFIDLRKKSEDFAISASSIKLYEQCSWKYFSNKILRLPKTTNAGAARGDCAHKIFECLLNPRHKKHYDKIIKTKNIKKCKPVYRLILKLINKYEVLREEYDSKGNHNLNLICEMVLTGLGYDFFCNGYEILGSEHTITINEHDLKVNGFIDVLSFDKERNKLLIRDFKSSAPDSSEDFTTQALTYILWAKRIKNMDAVAQFIFLRKSDTDAFIQEYRFTDPQIDGFEMYIKSIYKTLRDININTAMSHFAYDDGYKKEGFSGAVVCGRSQYKGQLKKDGTEMYACEYKHPIEYYILLFDGKFKKSSYNKNDLEKYIDFGDKNRYSLVSVKYDGCPRFY